MANFLYKLLSICLISYVNSFNVSSTFLNVLTLTETFELYRVSLIFNASSVTPENLSDIKPDAIWSAILCASSCIFLISSPFRDANIDFTLFIILLTKEVQGFLLSTSFINDLPIKTPAASLFIEVPDDLL